MRTRLALLAAILLGIVAALGVRAYLTRKDMEYERKAVRYGILVARENLNPGDALTESAVRELKVDEGAITESHILYDQRGPWLRQKLMRKVRAGYAIMKEYFLAEPEREEFAARRIQRKWRAITIGTDQIAGVAGLINPGSHVDILGTFRERGVGPDSAASMVTRVIARNVEVLATDTRTSVRMPVRPGSRPQLDRGYSSITLHVNPLEASLLTYAQNTGKLVFVLRNLEEETTGEEGGVPPVTQTVFEDLLHVAETQRVKDLRKPLKSTVVPPVP